MPKAQSQGLVGRFLPIRRKVQGLPKLAESWKLACMVRLGDVMAV